MTFQKRLLRELDQLLPGSQWRVVQERPWFSLTFSGVQMTFATTSGCTCDAQKAAAVLEAHEFTLPGQIVADIGVDKADRGLVVVLLVLEG